LTNRQRGGLCGAYGKAGVDVKGHASGHFRLKNGATWQVLGSDRYDAAVGSPPYGFSEWALSNPAGWAYLAPIVIENGGWALFITTARGRNHAKSMLDMAKTRPDWFSEVLRRPWR
jgi:phage terminase large subunit